jgi:lipoate-protein ligase A
MLKIIKEIQANPELATKSLNQDYLKVLNDFEQRFKLWNPNVYVYVEGGLVQGASADCNMFFNLFDDDNEKETDPEKLEPGEESYQEKKDMWEWMIESGHKDGSLKAIF